MFNKDKIFLCCDRAIITCLCFLIFCLPFAKAGVETFTWLALALWILKRAVGYRSGALWGMLPKTKLNGVLSVYIIANAISINACVNTGLFLRGFFGKELKFLFIYFALVEVINTKKRLLCILITLIASAVLIVVDAAVQYYTGTDFLRSYSIDTHTFGASFITASSFSAWLIVIIPIFLGIIAANVFQSLKIKNLLLLSVIIQLMFLLRTYSRGAWFGFLIAILFTVVYFIRSYPLRIKILCLTGGLTVAACLLTAVLFLQHFLDSQTKYNILTRFRLAHNVKIRVESIPQVSQGSNLERIMLWKESLKIIRDYPLTGCGLNNYSIVARNYKSFESGGIYPHNSFLHKAAETGIFGLFAFLFVLFNFFKIGILYLNKEKNYLVLGLLMGILAFLVHAFFDTHLYSLQLVVLFWYMLGLTIAVINLEPKKEI